MARARLEVTKLTRIDSGVVPRVWYLLKLKSFILICGRKWANINLGKNLLVITERWWSDLLVLKGYCEVRSKRKMKLTMMTIQWVIFWLKHISRIRDRLRGSITLFIFRMKGGGKNCSSARISQLYIHQLSLLEKNHTFLETTVWITSFHQGQRNSQSWIVHINQTIRDKHPKLLIRIQREGIAWQIYLIDQGPKLEFKK
jgi:hypothetical protein